MPPRNNGDGEETPRRNTNLNRISVTLDEKTKYYVRVASAFYNMTPGEWVNSILAKAAEAAIPDEMKELMKAKARKDRAAKRAKSNG